MQSAMSPALKGESSPCLAWMAKMMVPVVRMLPICSSRKDNHLFE